MTAYVETKCHSRLKLHKVKFFGGLLMALQMIQLYRLEIRAYSVLSHVWIEEDQELALKTDEIKRFLWSPTNDSHVEALSEEITNRTKVLSLNFFKSESSRD
jgi:hypothetical protein